MYKLSKRSLERLQDVDSLLIAIAVDSVRESPYDFGIPLHGGKRTSAEQNALWKLRPKVTNKDGYIKKSYHQSGKAFDIYAYVNGKANWDIEIITAIARHIQKVALNRYKVNLKWGGDWKNFKDYPHFQM
jgi:peptidoglycan L-alanyl-D-glutamate endopeptidase CwlK